MQRKRLTTAMTALAVTLIQTPAAAQKLHVNSRWKECSFQIDPSLTYRSDAIGFREMLHHSSLTRGRRPWMNVCETRISPTNGRRVFGDGVLR